MSETEKISLEEQVYSITAKYSEHLPIENDRHRLGYCLFKYKNGEADSPEIIVKTNKFTLVGISESELAKKIESDLAEI